MMNTLVLWLLILPTFVYGWLFSTRTASTQPNAILRSELKTNLMKSLDFEKQANNIDDIVKNLIDVNPTTTPCDKTSLIKFSTGRWQICYAPHIRVLEKILLTSFDVFYDFDISRDSSSRDSFGLTSNVYYNSKLFGSGWLNTQGKVTSVSDTICQINWENIWWDVNSQIMKASALTDVKKHILPELIQAIGTKGFIEGVSKFPVVYLDENFVVFEFSLFGTRICARRIE